MFRKKVSKSISKPGFWFTLLFIYVLLQFVWWAYLLVELNEETYDLNLKLAAQLSGSENALSQQQHQLQNKFNGKLWMILGEGSVFFFLLLMGFLKVRQSIKKEIELARQQRNFLLSVTHELNTPVTSIKLYLETLQKRDLPDEKRNHFLENAISESSRLRQLIGNILLSTRMDNQVIQLKKTKVNLRQFLKGNLNRFNGPAPEKIKLEVKDNLEVEADEEALFSIFNNLLENARKYAHEGHVTIWSDAMDSRVRIIDEGPGIANLEKERVFQKFTRIGNEETRQTKGTGLGLYIVKKLVEAHGWQIKVMDNKPQGSIFEVSFS